MNRFDHETIRTEMEQAVRAGVFPGGVLLAARKGEILGVLTAGRLAYEGSSPAVTERTIYDLASLTKVLSTTLLAMIFIDRGGLALGDRLEELWDGPVPPDKKEITLARLLSHASGLPAWRPLYRRLRELPVRERRRAAAEAILAEPLVNAPGRQATYTDLGFILLGFILERVSRVRQDELFSLLIAQSLGLTRTRYRPLDHPPFWDDDLAPTEEGPRFSGPPGDPQGESLDSTPVGVVHDDNAAALSGVAGHAGLFGTAAEVWLIFQAMRSAYYRQPGPGLVTEETIQTFWRRSNEAPGSTWALGFDTPAEIGSSAGRLFSRHGLGHLGYTGTSLWHDLDRDLTVILLTNRVHPTAENWAIREFRPRLHDAVVKACSD
ncbi:MAG: serine hydrolase domain-containing protein [Thermodesulfobacteriota bacterium]